MKLDGFLLIVAKGTQIISGLLLIRMVTSLLEINEVGEYYIFLSIYLFFSLIMLNPYGQYMTRNLYGWKSDNFLSSEIKKYINVVVFFSLLGFLLLLFLVKINIIKLNMLKLVFCIGYLIFVTINQFLLNSINSLGYPKKFSQITIVLSVLSVVLPAFFIFFENIYLDKVESLLLGIILANLISMFLCYFYLIRLEKGSARKSKKSDIKEIIFYCIPICVYTSLLWVINSGYRVGVEGLIGLTAVAILAVSFTVSTQLMSVVESLTIQVFQPKILQKMDLQDKTIRAKYLSQYVNETINIYFCFSIFFSLCIKYAFLVMVSSKYIDYFYLGIIAIWSEFFRVSCNSLSIVYFSENYLRKFVYPYLIAAIFLILNFVLIKNNIFKSINLINFCAFLILCSNLICFLFAWVFKKNIANINVCFKFFSKRVLFVCPAFILLLFIFNVSTINMTNFIIICIVSSFYLALFLLSLRNVSVRGI
ncbi:hypothetical protein D7V21_10080 [Acinetobacter guerrae]|uniref:Polysaccharide biosynthesis protein n=2 Tax=Acinetobacter guerrae TaxID=1843371 RepID=A0A3A8EEX4_9GAMM|nr:hypothetical protein [Acinetobacter guerrae]RKG33165.1 hypothetical protein D7V21_10080 [Acinetobacter guerrae]